PWGEHGRVRLLLHKSAGVQCRIVHRARSAQLQDRWRRLSLLLWPRFLVPLGRDGSSLLARTPALAIACLQARFQTALRTSRATNSIQGARHAVLRTLYSRARRVGLNGASCALCSLGVDSSFGLSEVATVGLLFQPAFEVVVLLEQELERFAYDVGRSCVDELGVPVQVVSDFFLQTNLNGCGFWLCRRYF